MSPATCGGPGGKWLGRKPGPMSPAELREVLADLRDQLRREPEVLDALGEAILSRDLATTSEILTHLRDLFAMVEAVMRFVTVADRAPA